MLYHRQRSLLSRPLPRRPGHEDIPIGAGNFFPSKDIVLNFYNRYWKVREDVVLLMVRKPLGLTLELCWNSNDAAFRKRRCRCRRRKPATNALQRYQTQNTALCHHRDKEPLLRKSGRALSSFFLMASALSSCVSSLQSTNQLLSSSISILDSGVNDFPRLSKVLQTTRVCPCSP